MNEQQVEEAEPTGRDSGFTPHLEREYREEHRDELQEDLDLDNPMAVPELRKITVNMGLGDLEDPREQIQAAREDLARMTGQQPVVTRARKSIAGFNIREGDPIGLKVTLRGSRMYAFLERLVKVVIPRIKDFRGLDPHSMDGQGNFSFGIDEQVTFPGIEIEEIMFVQGMDICITTDARNDREGLALLEALGMPFQDQ